MDYAGLTTLEAIQAGTSNGALMLGLEGRVGVVAPGMIADLIIVDGDPVRDIRVLQRRECIETVIQGGAVVVFDEEKVARSWPHERGIGYSVGDLTYAVVHGGVDTADPVHAAEADGRSVHDLESSDEANDLVSALSRRETAARVID
jgi:hypothetical protein